jgi:hypothetical protein
MSSWAAEVRLAGMQEESVSRRRSFLSDFVFYGIVVRRKVFL